MKPSLCLIRIMTQPNIKVLWFLMRVFWGSIHEHFGFLAAFLAHCESVVWDINTVVLDSRW